MDFTEVHKQTANLVAFSPGNQFILLAHEDRITIRRVDTFQIARTWIVPINPERTLDSAKITARNKPAFDNTIVPPTSDVYITQLSWSKDSEYIMATYAKAGCVMLFSLFNEDWNARIDVGPEGLARAEWAPDGRSVLCFSEWGVSVQPFSLTLSAILK